MKKVRVFGRPEVIVSTVVEVPDDADADDIFTAAEAAFKGIGQLVGNGGYGDKMIGVYGPDDTIIADAGPVFDDFTEEL